MTALTAPPDCVNQAGSWCANLYNWTHSDFLATQANVLVSGGFRILFIILGAFVVRAVLHHLVTRVVEGAGSGKVARLLGRAPKGLRPSTQMSARREQRARTIASVLRSMTSAIVLLIAAIMVLAEFGVNLAPILASAGIVGVAVGFGAQNLVKDFLSGMFMLLEDQYGVGDVIDVGAASGVVESVGLRITTLRDVQGTVWYVRNGEILRVGNKSQGYAVAVVDMPVAHQADMAAVTALAGRVATTRVGEDDIAADVIEPPEVLGIEKITVDGATVRLTVKVQPGRQWAVQRALNAALTDAFDDEHVPRPAPVGSGGTLAP